MSSGVSPPIREPSTIGDAGWAGAIFLPQTHRHATGNLFFARLQGYTRTYPFVPTQDLLVLKPGRDGDVVHALVDSKFVGQEWIVREDATHTKSKTYPRSELFFKEPNAIRT
jgi:hypothetical protein